MLRIFKATHTIQTSHERCNYYEITVHMSSVSPQELRKLKSPIFAPT